MKLIDILMEDLGNLKKIDPSLRSIFDPKTTVFGRDSKITNSRFEPAIEIFKKLTDPKGTIRGVIILVGGVQMFGISANEASASSLSDISNLLEIILSAPAWEKRVEIFGVKNSFSQSRNRLLYDSSMLEKVIDDIVDYARKNRLNLRLMYVHIDEERTKLIRSRKISRDGMVPRQRSRLRFGKFDKQGGLTRAYINTLKKKLERKLEKFKSQKYKTFSSPEELLRGVIESGHLKHFKIGDITYEFSSGSGNLGQMVFGKDEVFFEYTANNNDIEEYFEREFEKGVEEGMTVKDARKRALALERSIPGYIKIYLGLNGSSIVPVRVEARG